MNKIVLILILLSINLLNCNGQDKSKKNYYIKPNEQQVNYMYNDSVKYIHRLEEIIKKQFEKKSVSDVELISIIPSNSIEFILYLSFDGNEKTNNDAWLSIDTMIVDRAQFNSKLFLKLLAMSEFVDGYYAESYFEDIEYIISKYQKNTFCDNYYLFSEKYKWRLEDFYNNYCK